MRKSILFIMPSLSAGGTENYVLRFLKHAGNDLYRWHLLSLDQVRGDLHDSFQAAGAIIHYQSIGYVNPLKLYKLYRLIRNERVETICTFTGNFGGSALAVASVAGVKTRIGWYRATERAYRPTLLRKQYDKMVNRLLWSNATYVLSNSHAALERNRPSMKIRCPIRVIDNGVDATLFQTDRISKDEAKRRLNISPSTFTVSHVARVDPAKNHATIFKTMAEVQKRLPNVLFIFCGKGTDSPNFLDALRQQGLEGIALGLGLRKDLNYVYAASDLFYFPSITEGQPNALIEAMICEVPILASNIKPIQEVLPKELHDFLIDPYDWEKAAERIISLALGDTCLPCRFREYAIARFNPNLVFDSFLELL